MMAKKQTWEIKKRTRKTPLVVYSGKSFIQVSRKLTKAEEKKMKVKWDEEDPEYAWDLGNILTWFYQRVNGGGK